MPLELLTMLGGGLLSGVMTLWGKSLEAKKQQQNYMLQSMKTQGDIVDQARRYGNPGFQFTRRAIALMAVFAVVVWPKLVAVFMPELSVTVGWTEWDPGFLFIEGSNETRWETLTGLVLTPLDTHLMSAIVGLYFGASVVKNAG